MNNNYAASEISEYYDLLLVACRCALPASRNCIDLAACADAYRRMRTLLEHLCYEQMPESSLQMTDLSARINFVGAKVGLSVVEQNRLHTFRLTGNAILNRQAEVQPAQLLRDAKTLAFFVKRLTGADIPAPLYALLPAADATYVVQPPAHSYKKRLRVSFQEADETYLYVLPVDEVADTPWRVRYGVPQVNEEFNRSVDLLWRHARLNLLEVGIDAAGVLTPQFIILEPDYLIDISALAECYKDYGHHPANYLMARLQTPENTKALLLGNIANLFLDEWIYADTAPDYLSCMQKAFRRYPIELATCPDLRERKNEAEFFADCRRHFDNIRRIVTEVFPAAGYDLDKGDAVLEPSYVCEALGLQGRLDYMQRDMTSFIEMKSGKADEYSLRGKIEPRENNRVQMQLYQAVLEYSMGMDHHHVHSYLLYTRYPLLYPARSSWAMVRRAMDLRNRIVATEYGIQLRNSAHYTARCLQQINRDTLNERQLTNTLWKRYQAPAIDLFAQRLEQLSPLEQSYFHTLYNFITKELYTSKSGDTDYEGRSGAAGLWLSTLAEKQEAGEILVDLRLLENNAACEQRPTVTLQTDTPPTDGEGALPNFRQGDAVVLYERNSETDNVTNRMVLKGSIESITPCRLTIRLRAAQRNERVLPAAARYAVEHDTTMDVGFRTMYQGLGYFLQANRQRRDLLLCRRNPETDAAFRPAIAAAADDFERITRKAQAARDYFLLVGPPGTGKTSRALRGMVQAFHAEGKEILLLSYTNRAVDEICKMLSQLQPAVDFIRIGGEHSCEPAYRNRLLDAVLEPCRNRREVQQRLADCRIFVGTVSTISGRTDLFRLKRFDVALIDEATQILEPQLLGLLTMRAACGDDAIGKFILIGDHKQLPAVVQQSEAHSAVACEDLQAIGLHNLKDSLFERLYRRAVEQGHTAVCDMLCRQGRMNPEVARFPNRAFYDGRLQPVGLPHQSGDLQVAAAMQGSPWASLLARRVAFIPSQPEPPEGAVKSNRSEARIVADVAEAVYGQYQATEGFCAHITLGIITPYRSQIALIKRALAEKGIPALNEVVVDTVERFQGSERDVIVYSFCVNRLYQLRFLANLTEDNGVLVDRKLNVALTRARKQMFMTGVPLLLKSNPIYKELIESCEAEG